MPFYRVNVSGETHYQAAIREVRVGQPVLLMREPDNPHDARAVSIWSTQGRRIGYVARGSFLHDVLEEGQAVDLTVDGLHRKKSTLAVVLMAELNPEDEVGSPVVDGSWRMTDLGPPPAKLGVQRRPATQWIKIIQRLIRALR